MNIGQLEEAQRKAQAEAWRVLAAMIARGQEAGLAPLTWIVPPTGDVVGEASLHYIPQPEQTLRAWAELLGLSVVEEWTDCHQRFYARRRDISGDPAVTVLLEHTIPHEFDCMDLD